MEIVWLDSFFNIRATSDPLTLNDEAAPSSFAGYHTVLSIAELAFSSNLRVEGAGKFSGIDSFLKVADKMGLKTNSIELSVLKHSPNPKLHGWGTTTPDDIIKKFMGDPLFVLRFKVLANKIGLEKAQSAFFKLMAEKFTNVKAESIYHQAITNSNPKIVKWAQKYLPKQDKLEVET
ncbi:hypothetical protein Plhal304r1_c008g0031381 [Plasmopara halstedii]